ncbi:MAG: hypothetical protein M0Q22_06610 [Sulfuritalea sp.]|jgi:hypothetical protein|nr:hypothetical protein [Sulfuritalea sp.]
MTFKEKLENSPFLAIAITGITAFAAGWGAHVAILQQSQLEAVPRGAYVLKEEIDSGASPVYVARKSIDQMQTEQPNFMMIRSFSRQTSTEVCRVTAVQVAAKHGFVVLPSEGNELMAQKSGYALTIACVVQFIAVAGPELEEVKSLSNHFYLSMTE